MKSILKRTSLYAGVAATLIAASGALLALSFDSPLERHSIMFSALLAFLVQVGAFAIAARGDFMTGWGIGVLVRFLALVVHALLVVQVVGLAPAAALISLATFFFVCTLAEPVLLQS